MPIWEFNCESCKETKDIITKMGDDELVKPCTITEKCEGKMSRKQINSCTWKPGRSFFNGGYVSN